jgi:hypothetical protein
MSPKEKEQVHFESKQQERKKSSFGAPKVPKSSILPHFPFFAHNE